MTLLRLAIRNLSFNKGMAAATILGTAVATAALTGSLLLGTSARASLRNAALARLGRINAALTGSVFFDAAWPEHLKQAATMTDPMAAALLLPGTVTHAESGVTVARITVAGVDDHFWALFGEEAVDLQGRSVALNARLAHDLKAKADDALIVSVRRHSDAPGDTLFGRRERGAVLSTLRTTTAHILPEEGAGLFSLARETTPERTLFVSRAWLAEHIEQPGQANTLLAALRDPEAGLPALQAQLSSTARLQDRGLQAKTSADARHIIVSSRTLTLSPRQVETILAAANDAGSTGERVSIFLATTLAHDRGASLAYAMVAGLEAPERLANDSHSEPFDTEAIAVNAWAAERLDAVPGDRVKMTFFAVTRDGAWPELTRDFVLHSIAPMTNGGADPELTPDLEGLTEAEHVSTWDPPFPVDTTRVTEDDEGYWRDWRAAPKAFVTLAAIRQIWQDSTGQADPDWVTSVRIPIPNETDPTVFLDEVKLQLQTRLARHPGPLRFEPVRAQALAAAEGSQDLGTLFLSMSFFVMAAALTMAGMMMRLALRRRAAQTGVLLACGFRPTAVKRLILLEGLMLVGAGVALSLPAALLYATGLIRALGDTGGVLLQLQATRGALVTGTLGGALAAGAALGIAARAQARQRPLDLLAGWQHADTVIPAHAGRVSTALAGFGLGGAALVLMLAKAGKLTETHAFFAAGAAILIGGLAAAHAALIHGWTATRPRLSLRMLALRSLAANRGRSMTTAGLFAAASFILVAVAANRRDFSSVDPSHRDSGTGGFSLQAVSTMPIHYDFGTPAGREQLGFAQDDESTFEHVRVISMLATSGDDASCLNAAQALNPRVVGVGPEMIERGGFTVRLDPVAAQTVRDGNPWTALDAETEADPIPVFGDADSVLWQLHSGLGERLTLSAADGTEVDVRIAGILAGSILAGELLMAERHVRRLFPDEHAPRHFLIETPTDQTQAVAAALRRTLGERGLDVWTTREHLNALTAVQNTYMTLFLALGGLGTLLGAFGLGTLLAGEVLERRAEMALMSAVGLRRSFPRRLLVLEHTLTLAFGLALGTGAALTAVAPALRAMETDLSVQALAGWPLAIALFGTGLCSLTAHLALRQPPIHALRND